MVLANQAEDPENRHPYWYARVIGIFHAMVLKVGSGTVYEQIDFLWVRWYGLDIHSRSGFKARRLHQVGFLNSNDDTSAFGLLILSMSFELFTLSRHFISEKHPYSFLHH